MSLEELYKRIGGDYADALSRLRNERLVGRMVAKLPKDGSIDDLERAWAAGDDETAFRAVHTAKGVYANLSLVELRELASRITEALRPGNEQLRAQTDVGALIDELVTMHEKATAAISEYVARS